ncbi:hypothetical protein [Ammoniphilus sp. YIM 78166]|uniref:hypothetical protein n=1 Tax=Ammoniphilus sp. YIM 78166 TaxID=1644106 RepID=UPI00106FCC51|nr:hypothetical protein [Ammoniphilus sp. YIM 78166]
MLILISSALIIGYTIYACVNTNSKRQWVSCSMGKCISMALGMVSSTMIGLLLALLLPGELAYSTVLSILVSGIFAFFIGKPFGVSGVIEALSASFMGAMMGAMLGDMTPQNREAFMIIAMDVIFLFSVLALMLMVNKEAFKQKARKGIQLTPIILSLVLSFSVLGLAATLDKSPGDANKSTEVKHEHNH